MTKTNILDKEEYTQLVIYIYKKGEHLPVKAQDITKDLSEYFTNRRNFSMKIQELKKIRFIESDGYGRHTKYKINEYGIIKYWIENYISKYGYTTQFSKIYLSNNEQYKFLVKVFFRNFLFFASKKREIKLSTESKKRLIKDKRSIKKEMLVIQPRTIKQGFEMLRQHMTMRGFESFFG